MACKDCGHTVSMNKMCEKPLQSAIDILKHMATHKASRAFASVGVVPRQGPEIVPVIELAHALGIPAQVDRLEFQSPNLSPLPQSADSPGSP